MNNESDLHELAALYALDALTNDERQAFEAHHSTCGSCRAEVAALRETAAELAADVAQAPPADLKARVMAELGATSQVAAALPDGVVDLADQRQRRNRRLAVVSAAAAALVAVIVAVGALRGPADSDFDRLLAADDVVITDLEGEQGTVQVAWSAERDQLAVIGNGLHDPGQDHEYALWYVLADGVVAAGEFVPVDGQIRSVLDAADHDLVGWGITIEPEGGSEQPTSDILFIGTI